MPEATKRPPRRALIKGREVRTFATTLEARDNGGLQFVLEGYASLTEVPYSMGTYTETIRSGAFATTISQRPDVQLLINHEGLPLARSTVPGGQIGSLELTEDSKGLRFIAQLDRDDPDAQTLMRKIGNQLLDQCSFGFTVTRQSWSDDRSQRFISEVSMARGDVSVVNQAASPTTSVSARGAAARRSRAPLSIHQARALALKLRGGGR